MVRKEVGDKGGEEKAREVYGKIEAKLVEFYENAEDSPVIREQLAYAFTHVDDIRQDGWKGGVVNLASNQEVIDRVLKRWHTSATVNSILAAIPVSKGETEEDFWRKESEKLIKKNRSSTLNLLKLLTPISGEVDTVEGVMSRLQALGRSSSYTAGPIELMKSVEDNLKINENFRNFVEGQEEYFAFNTLWPLMRAVYGQRMKYWAEARRMLEEYENREKEKKVVELRKRDAEFAQNQQRLKCLETVKPSEEEGLAHRVEVHGDKGLSGSEYVEAELGPKYLIPSESKDDREKSFYVSEPFELGPKRLGVIFYVPQGDKLVARSYYLSNSSCQWRYLPAYWQVGGQVRHFDKGWDECSLPAPTYFQRALADLSNNVSAKSFSLEKWQKYFLGTARSIANKDVAARTYKKEVSPVARKLPGKFYSDPEGKRRAPEEVDFHNSPEAQVWKPDFSEVVMSWTQKSKQHGEVLVEVFYSKNGKCSYSFYTDKKGRSCISVELLGEIGSTGLRSEWVDPGDLGTPLIEYYKQARGYGGEGVDEDYQEMWSEYLSKVPLIKEYQASKKQRGGQEHRGQTRELELGGLFEGAQSFDELYFILKDMSGIPGASNPTITGKIWIKIIQDVVAGRLGINSVTSGSGLRKAVLRLMQVESARKNIH